MNETEIHFFEAFSIEKKPVYSGSKLYNPFLVGYEYPQITDSVLLELICILTAWHLDEREPYEITGYNIKRLKNQVLQDCISLKNSQKVKEKVQTLFKESV